MFLKGTGMSLEEDVAVTQSDEIVSQENIDYIINGGIKKETESNNSNREIKQEAQTVLKEEIPLKKPKLQQQPKQKIREQMPVSIKPMQYENFDDYDEEDLHQEQFQNLELIKSVPLEISVEIGKTKKPIKEILEFAQGTIVELDKQAGALVDIVINGQLIAKGEVVVVNDNFGVRVVEILKKDEIIKMTL
jgi:flagellar motor switch protein FliN/FliY